jgi:hypothetical protein
VTRKAVYLLLILTMLTSAQLVPNALSQPENVKVVSYSYYIDSLGYLTVVGEIENTGTSTISRVIIAGLVTTADGSQLESSAQAWVRNLIPQQKAPFYMEFLSQNSGIWSGISDIELQVVMADSTTNYLYPDLQVTSNKAIIGTSSEDKGVYWVTGTIQNTGTQVAKNVRVIGTFYNSSGAVVAVGGYTSETVTTQLSPQAKVDFKFGAFDMNQSIVPQESKISTYSLLLQVDEPILQGTAPPITPTTPSNPAITNSPESTNNSAPEWAYIVVIAIVIAAIATTVLKLKKRSSPKASKNKSVKPKKPNRLSRT